MVFFLLFLSSLQAASPGTFCLPGNPDARPDFVHKSGGGRSSTPQDAAVSAHFFYQRSNRIDRGLRQDAVAEIEDMARLRAESVEHATHRLANRVRRREQGGGIEISLQRDAPGGDAARFSRIRSPVEADGIGAARNHFG